MVVPDTRIDPRFSGNPFVTGNPNITFYAGCPVRAPDGRNIGSLCAIDNKVRTLSPDQLTALADLAKILESELKVAQLSKAQYDLINELDNIQRQSMIDPTTRIWNRAGIDDLMKREWDLALKNATPLSVVRAHILDFQQINEHHGEVICDEIVKIAAKRFLAVLRPEDEVSRISDHEFQILLPGYPADKLQETVEHICEAVTGKLFATTQGRLEISMNMGAATTIPDHTRLSAALIQSADKALQEAQTLGPDKVQTVSLT